MSVVGRLKPSAWGVKNLVKHGKHSSPTKHKPFKRSFPHDILCLVAEWAAFLDFASLKLFSLANKACFDAANRFLWRNVTILWHGAKVRSFGALDEQLDVLVHSPYALRRLRHVKYLTLEFNAHIAQRERSRVMKRLSLLLESSTTLCSLDLSDGLDELALGSLLLHTSLPELGLVELRYQPKPTPAFVSFLIDHLSLRRLWLDHTQAQSMLLADMPDSSLPNLEVIHVHCDLLQTFVQGRPIKYISTTARSSTLASVWQALSSSSTPVRSLSLRLQGPRAFKRLLSDLPEYGSSLRFLGCSWEDSPISALLKSDFSALRTLDSLECVRWSGSKLGSYLHAENDAWNPSTYAGPALEVVQFEVDVNEGKGGKFVEEGMWLKCQDDAWTLRKRCFASPPLRHGRDRFVSFQMPISCASNILADHQV
ncbi:hypothetical protein DL93DRAFT_2165569 [Clavulina sp. PMI_390]|nr:hypothetical protein DL93DRAFT_2165569 [Clavulina sp. PMI_390]